MRTALVLGLLLVTSSVDTAIPPHQTAIRTRAFLGSRLQFKPGELSKFMEMAYKGAGEKSLPVLACICLAETNNDYRLRNKYGRLGGHLKTILKGAKECGENPKIKWLEAHPEHKTRYLAVRYKTLLGKFNGNVEKTCRVWNQGPGWQNPKADRYWKTITHFRRMYASRN